MSNYVIHGSDITGASEVRLDPEQLTRLAQDEHPAVRLNVARRHRETPVAVLMELTRDADDAVSTAAYESLQALARGQ